MFLPLLDPPASSGPACLPGTRKDENAPFADIVPGLDWTVSQHVCPAAWPRSRTRAANFRSKPFEPVHFAFGRDKAKLQQEYETYRDFVAGDLLDIRDVGAYEDQELLYLSLNRYRPSKRPKQGRTLIFLQATGICKELSEPYMAHLLASPAGSGVAECWTIDFPTHGLSALLNAGRTGDSNSYFDTGRDVLNFLLLYLPTLGNECQLVLERQPLQDPSILLLDQQPNPAKSSLLPWRGHHPVIIGHSVGGNGALLASFSQPHLFDAVVVQDPMTMTEDFIVWDNPRRPPIGMTLRRVDTWQSKEAARQMLTRPKAPMREWNSAVLDRYMEFALKTSANGTTLVMRKQDEALFLCEKGPNDRLIKYASTHLHRLADHFDRSRIHWISPRIGASWSTQEQQQHHLDVLAGCSHDRIDASHVLPIEKPAEVAISIARFLGHLDSISTGDGDAGKMRSTSSSQRPSKL